MTNRKDGYVVRNREPSSIHADWQVAQWPSATILQLYPAFIIEHSPLLNKNNSQEREKMMATLANVVLTGTAYQNLNSATGLITGSPLVIQNKGNSFVRLVIAPSQPAASSENGYLLTSLATVVIENETDIIWAKSTDLGNTALSVQLLV
jgi:hypothetical protein